MRHLTPISCRCIALSIHTETRVTLLHVSDYQVKLSEKFDQLGNVIKELVNVGNSGDTSAIKSSVANLERMQNSLVRQIESNG